MTEERSESAVGADSNERVDNGDIVAQRLGFHDPTAWRYGNDRLAFLQNGTLLAGEQADIRQAGAGVPYLRQGEGRWPETFPKRVQQFDEWRIVGRFAGSGPGAVDEAHFTEVGFDRLSHASSLGWPGCPMAFIVADFGMGVEMGVSWR
jgi:hypothetical protein